MLQEIRDAPARMPRRRSNLVLVENERGAAAVLICRPASSQLQSGMRIHTIRRVETLRSIASSRRQPRSDPRIQRRKRFSNAPGEAWDRPTATRAVHPLFLPYAHT